MTIQRLLPFLSTLLLAGGLVLGQGPGSQDRKWEFSVFGGWNSLNGANSFLTAVDDGSTNLVGLETSSSWAAGMRVGENLNQFVGFDIEYSFADAPATFINLSPDLPLLSINQGVHNFTYNATFHLRNRRGPIRPFVVIGGGGSFFHVSDATVLDGLVNGVDLKSRWKFAFNWGLGVKFAVTPKWGLRVDFRDSITGVPDYGLPREAQTSNGMQTVGFRPEGVFHHYQVTAGFIYYFAYR